MMDPLPWHLQLVIYRGIGRDGLRSLGVRPGKLEVPHALREALGRSFGMRHGKRFPAAYIPVDLTTKCIIVPADFNPDAPATYPHAHVEVVDKAPNSKFLLSVDGVDWPYVF
jgi:hypothetical protein